MKNLLLIVSLLFILACTKQSTSPQTTTKAANTTSYPYVGTYVLTNNGLQGEYDTIAVSYNTSSTYYISRLCSNGGTNMLCNINGTACVLIKNNNYPNSNSYTEGTGIFSNTQLVLDYTNDRSDYAPSFHHAYHSIFRKL